MKISIGADHAGYELKTYLIKALSGEDFDFTDFGTNSSESVDYPDFAHPVAESVVNNEADFGIVICGSANGVAMSANKHKDVRCALCWLPEIASLARQHNNANMIALPARYLKNDEALEIVKRFIQSEFEGGRHLRRVEKIGR